jgi:ribosomal protein S18 acetylase RimI-like enzyme
MGRMIDGPLTSWPKMSGGAVRVRTFRSGDEGAVRALRGELDRVHAGLMPDYFRIPAESTVPARDPDSEILVADGAQGIGGFVMVRSVETPRDPTMTPRRRAHVEMMVVGKGARRRGVATMLMDAAHRWAAERGCSEVVLTVWSDNRAAEALYQSLGYEPIARVLRRSTAGR